MPRYSTENDKQEIDEAMALPAYIDAVMCGEDLDTLMCAHPEMFSPSFVSELAKHY